MPEAPSKAVLITGCSSGIGRAAAERLAGAGWTVYATARNVDAIEDLAQRGCTTLSLDVTDEESMRAAVARVEEEAGAVGVLVNNAGYSQSGALEELGPDEVRRQFETNVFGLLRITQLALPGMRRQRWGKVVNVGSMGGKLTLPGGGLYHATKYSVEAISDALRFEVRGFGVDVILLEPGLIKTKFGETAAGSVAATQAADGPYARFNATLVGATKETYEGPVGRLGGGPEAVAKTIERAITSRRPRARYPVTPSARLMIARRLMPDRLWDAMLARQLPPPGPSSG
jgi:NAD(P)-dependent dehydrogenase (short-subunit alcohol dehydrogenase family)